MNNRIILSLLSLVVITATVFSGCSKHSSLLKEDNRTQSTQEGTFAEEEPTEAPKIEFTTDQKVFLEITIDTKEDELQSIADKYGYHLGLTKYNAGSSNRSPEENYVYELYDPSVFKTETEEHYRYTKSYSRVQVTYYHAHDEADTQYVVSCKCNTTRGGKDTLVQNFDVETMSTTYWYLNGELCPAASSKEAVIAYLSK